MGTPVRKIHKKFCFEGCLYCIVKLWWGGIKKCWKFVEMQFGVCLFHLWRSHITTKRMLSWEIHCWTIQYNTLIILSSKKQTNLFKKYYNTVIVGSLTQHTLVVSLTWGWLAASCYLGTLHFQSCVYHPQRVGGHHVHWTWERNKI